MMEKLAKLLIIILVMVTLTSTPASAKVKSHVVTFGQDFVVGETVVRKGTYKLIFDEKANELTIADKKTNMIAKTGVHLEKRQNRASRLEIGWATKGERQVLTSVAFPGDSQSMVVRETGGQASGTK